MFQQQSRCRFGSFEVDRATGEVWHSGRPVRLARQPAMVLALLVSRPGQLITREDVRQHVWPDTVVEFDDAINGCIRRIRLALGDDAHVPNYIQTIPRMGYRFIAPVVEVGPASNESRVLPGHRGRSRWWVGAAASMILGLAGVYGAAGSPPDPPVPTRPGSTGVLLAAVDGNEARSLLAQGYAHWRRNLDRDGVLAATRLFRESAAADSSLAEASSRLAIALYTLAWEFGQADGLAEAEAALARASSLAPDEPATLMAQGYHHYYGGRRYPEAQAAFERALALRPDDPEILVPLAYVLRRKGEFRKAAGLFERAYKIDPNSFEVIYALATTYDKMQQHSAAMRWYDLAHAADPEAWFLYRERLMLTLERTGDPAAGLEFLKRMAPEELQPSVIFSSASLSRIYARELRGQLAERMDGRGSDPRLLVHAGYLLQAWGDTTAALARFDSARVMLESAGAREPAALYRHLPWAQFYLVRAYAGLGWVEATRAQVDRLLLVFTPGRDWYSGPFVRAVAAEALAAIGDHQRALDILERLAHSHTVVTPGLLRADPAWATLRRHPRFERLLRRWPGNEGTHTMVATGPIAG